MAIERLNVVAVLSNPRRTESRVRLARDFIPRMLDSGVDLTLVEHAFGERDHELSYMCKHVNYVPVRGGANQELWLKEALARVGFSRIKNPNWKYGALIDADVQFQREDWAEEAVHMLQHYRVGQPWTHSVDLGPKGEVVTNEWGNDVDRSFSAAWIAGDVYDDLGTYGNQSRALLLNKGQRDWRQHYGFAWCFRREAYDGMGGLIDWMVTGAADYHMAMGFSGMLTKFDERMTPGYIRRLTEFQMRCERHVKQDIGCVPGMLMHHWHGKKKNRFYLSRFEILVESKFDPDLDLAWDSQHLPSLNGDNRLLRDGLRRYNMSRHEDSVDIE